MPFCQVKRTWIRRGIRKIRFVKACKKRNVWNLQFCKKERRTSHGVPCKMLLLNMSKAVSICHDTAFWMLFFYKSHILKFHLSLAWEGVKTKINYGILRAFNGWQINLVVMPYITCVIHFQRNSYTSFGTEALCLVGVEKQLQSVGCGMGIFVFYTDFQLVEILCLKACTVSVKLRVGGVYRIFCNSWFTVPFLVLYLIIVPIY